MTRNARATLVLAMLSLTALMGADGKGCGYVVIGGGEDPAEPGPGTGQDPGPGPSQDPGSCAGELHILGVYETHSDHGYGNHPPGAATVHVERQGSMVLALSSYEPVHWTITTAPGAVLEKVILNGYHHQTAAAPPGVPVETYDGPGTSLGAYAYAWPSAEGGSDTPALVAAVEQVAGREMTSFHGCYQATSFVLHQDLGVTAACTDGQGELTGHVEPDASDGCEPKDDPESPCAGASGTGHYVGYYCDYGHEFIITPDISCDEALDNCQLNASLNPDLSFYCTWEGQPIHEAEVTAGACDWISGP